jgi:hypothetical protein
MCSAGAYYTVNVCSRFVPRFVENQCSIELLRPFAPSVRARNCAIAGWLEAALSFGKGFERSLRM